MMHDVGLCLRRLGAGMMMAAMLAGTAGAADLVRNGEVIGALAPMRVLLPQLQDKHNLAYEFKDFRDSTSTLLALDQKELDIGGITTQHLIRALEEGIAVVMVAGWGGGYNALVAKADLPVQKDDWAGLKTLAADRKQAGQPLRIGTPTGSMQHLKLIWTLREHGIDPDQDIRVLNIPFPTHPRALDAGEIDMAMTLALFGSISMVNGGGKLFHHVVGTRSGTQEIGIVVRRDLIEQRPDYVQRIVDSHVEAMKIFADDVDKQIELQLAYSKLPPPVAETFHRQFLRLNYRIKVDEMKGMAKEMHDVGWTKKDYSDEVETLIDFRFLEKATGLTKAELSRW